MKIQGWHTYASGLPADRCVRGPFDDTAALLKTQLGCIMTVDRTAADQRDTAPALPKLIVGNPCRCSAKDFCCCLFACSLRLLRRGPPNRSPSSPVSASSVT
ncbi:hypothetical protein ACCAA_10023 [Candidatus Accumulibacter aalborgensis]|uniref:Uncharacterized protein n=1 Tax=Candidatus Accumulibacter aalborgensis TaxID=1860102 RepID=A0A1A8XCY4_9PROT|nr:hypothetical protein ACCAA_10023 [Candidatus Accumulibacter aalborgensis]